MPDEPKKQEKGFWGKAWDVITWPARQFVNALTSPPTKKGCICRFFDFLAIILGYFLLLLIELWLFLFVLWVAISIILGFISAIPGVVIPSAITEAVISAGGIIFSIWWLTIFIGVAILWGIAVAIAYFLC